MLFKVTVVTQNLFLFLFLLCFYWQFSILSFSPLKCVRQGSLLVQPDVNLDRFSVVNNDNFFLFILTTIQPELKILKLWRFSIYITVYRVQAPDFLT